jgi:hypothetical protein
LGQLEDKIKQNILQELGRRGIKADSSINANKEAISTGSIDDLNVGIFHKNREISDLSKALARDLAGKLQNEKRIKDLRVGVQRDASKVGNIVIAKVNYS